MTFDLSDAHLVRIAEVDEQHRQLLAHLDSVLQSTAEGHGRADLPDFVAFLAGYTREHFATEERWMDVLGYPGYAEHAAAHRRFLDQVAAAIAESEASSTRSSVLVQTLKTVCDWVWTHVEEEDLKFAAHVAGMAGGGQDRLPPQCVMTRSGLAWRDGQ